MMRNQGREAAPHLRFVLQRHLVVRGYTGLVGPGKRTPKLHHFAMKALEALGFGLRPSADAWNVKEWEVAVLCGGFTPLMHGEEIACIVVQQHRKAKIGVQQTQETVERNVVLRSHRSAFSMELLDGLLPEKFVRVEDQDVG
jgi:hypothetical protein